MKIAIALLILLINASDVNAETRVYSTTPTGVIQYHKSSLVVKDNGKVIEVSPSGVYKYHKPQTKLEPKKGK